MDIPGVSGLRYDMSTLKDVVGSSPGLLASTEHLISLLRKSPRDWREVIEETRTYAIRNFVYHHRHERGPEAVKVLLGIFLEALTAPECAAEQDAMDGVLFYLEKILADSDGGLDRYAGALEWCLNSFSVLAEEPFVRIVRNRRQIMNMGRILLDRRPDGFDAASFNRLMRRCLRKTYDYWLGVEDPLKWLSSNTHRTSGDGSSEFAEALGPVSHASLRVFSERLEALGDTGDPYSEMESLVNMPGHMQIVKCYEDFVPRLSGDLGLKIAFLLKVIETDGLAVIHENTLRELSRTISRLFAGGEPQDIKGVLMETFKVLGKVSVAYPETALNCVQRIGNEVYLLNDQDLLEWVLQQVIALGFHYPEISGISAEWQVRTNKAHLRNIRVWLELIERKPKWSKSLISALIINLKLGGVYISDTDLFQKDITRLLNSNIRPVYHLIMQLARVFPVYFNDINAEGALREISTEIDEMSGRGDLLMHFLRKQIHVECSARVIAFMEEVITFWLTRDKGPLEKFLPEDFYSQIDESGRHVHHMHELFSRVFGERGFAHPRDLLGLGEDETRRLLEDVPGVPEKERRRAYLAVRLYNVLEQKYSLTARDIRSHLRYAQYAGLPAAEQLMEILDNGAIADKIEAILGYMGQLKEIIISEERFEAIEDIFRKRHIVAGIPSMYGRYIEKKFNALALTLRLENLANILFEDLLSSVNLAFITRATLAQIQKYAELFFRALTLGGIASNRLEHTLELLTGSLEVRRFSSSQYIDIFRGFSEALQDILNTYYLDMHKHNLRTCILQMGRDRLRSIAGGGGDDTGDFELINAVSERFLRDIVVSSYGLQQLDNFVGRILKTMTDQAHELDTQNLDLLMSYDPKKALSGIDTANRPTSDRILLGNKGFMLARLAALGIRVSPGFIVSTEVFRCLPAIMRFRHARDHLYREIDDQMVRLEILMGRKFGSRDNPLLVSVRSGSTISMPGMMMSLLNVGINPDIVEGLIKQTGRPWFAWDCYRRFLQTWGMSFGMERDHFDVLMRGYKRQYGVARKIDFSAEQMKDLAMTYRSVIEDRGIIVIDDPQDQLRVAVAQVFQSWHSETARAYREILGLSRNWGTAVLVQVMVYGNLDNSSGTGVFFTRNPQDPSDRVVLWGDYTTGAQGEDIVSGLVRTLPISREQNREGEDMPAATLEEAFPEIFDELMAISRRLIYDEQWGAQEIEFTFEGRRKEQLYILQTRDMTLTRRTGFRAFVPTRRLSESYVASGIGVGGLAMSGRIVFDIDDIARFRMDDPSTPLILIRYDTVPDDIRHISAADGLLTARGGSTSHAAVIAQRLGKTGVVGCGKLAVWEQEKRCKLDRLELRAGDLISLDGRNGAVYLGVHEVSEV